MFSCSSNVAEQSTESSDNGQHTVDYVDSMAEEHFFRSYRLYSGRGKKSRKDQDKNQKIIAKNSLVVEFAVNFKFDMHPHSLREHYQIR